MGITAGYIRAIIFFAVILQVFAAPLRSKDFRAFGVALDTTKAKRKGLSLPQKSLLRNKLLTYFQKPCKNL
jgi:hypothetical protein